MTYPFVASATDLGPAVGPRLAVCWHLAEGGGTVGYLSRPNPNGVSVHFVVEYSGRIVQMLQLDHMHSSIRTTDIRLSDDPDGLGRTAAVAVMGAWADIRTTLGPNHASIGVEVEGFAADGPNPAQSAACAELWSFLAETYPGIRSLGHRDFTSRKACPGYSFPWSRVGGHGKEGSMLAITDSTPMEITVAVGTPWLRLDGTKLKVGTVALDWRPSPFACGSLRAMFASTSGVRTLLLVSPSAVRPVPAPADTSPFTQADVDAKVAAAEKLAAAAVKAAADAAAATYGA